MARLTMAQVEQALAGATGETATDTAAGTTTEDGAAE